MTKKVVAIIGALDTKGAEYAFLKQQIEGQGVGTLMIDVGIFGDPRNPDPRYRLLRGRRAQLLPLALHAFWRRGLCGRRQSESRIHQRRAGPARSDHGVRNRRPALRRWSRHQHVELPERDDGADDWP
jgi:Uncharacterised protein family (UPF0261)